MWYKKKAEVEKKEIKHELLIIQNYKKRKKKGYYLNYKKIRLFKSK